MRKPPADAVQPTTLHRRTFLRRCGIGAAGLIASAPLLESVRAAARERVEIPRRLLVLFTPNGTIQEEFFRSTADGSLRFGRILAPLKPFKQHVLLLDGFTMDVTAIGPGNEHQRGMVAWLTGRPNIAGEFCGGKDCQGGASGWATGVSIDQWIMQQSRYETAFGSLELGVRVEGATNRQRMSFSGPNQPVAPDHDPVSVYRRLFGASPDDLERQIRVSDLLAKQYRNLMGRVSADDRTRLDSHLSAVESIERRLRAQSSAGRCEAPPREPRELDVKDEANYAAITELQSELLVAALRCDSTRVASLMWSDATSRVLPVWVNGRSYSDIPFDTPLTTNFHANTHLPYEDPSIPEQAEVRNKLLAIYRWYATAVARLLERMQQVIEPDGSTLLDNTAVIWGSELASPNAHTFERMPFVLAGGSKFLRTGRYLDYRGEQHTALLATLALAMGLPDERFGHPDFARAPLYDLLR